MRQSDIRLRRAWLGVLMLACFSVWADTQKPAHWVELTHELTLTYVDEAELILEFSSPIPAETLSITLELPAGITTSQANPWTETLTPHQTKTLYWPLQGPFDFSVPIVVAMVLTLPGGETLNHRAEVSWPKAERGINLRTSSPAGSKQNRRGETLWVVPLNMGTQ